MFVPHPFFLSSMSKEIEQDLKYTKKQVQAVEEFIESVDEDRPPQVASAVEDGWPGGLTSRLKKTRARQKTL